MRPTVLWFARQMEKKLKANDHKGGWEGCDPIDLLRLLRRELVELDDTIEAGKDGDVASEAADVANFAMMVADIYTPGSDKDDDFQHCFRCEAIRKIFT